MTTAVCNSQLSDPPTVAQCAKNTPTPTPSAAAQTRDVRCAARVCPTVATSNDPTNQNHTWATRVGTPGKAPNIGSHTHKRHTQGQISCSK